MRKELDNLLCTRYPKIFKNRNNTIQNSAMAWGFGCGDGWFVLIDQLARCIEQHVMWQRQERARALLYNRRLKKAIKLNDYQILINPKLKNHQYHIEDCKQRLYTQEYQEVPELVKWVVCDQVKEKFGTLRFYYHGGDACTDGMVQLAEMMSATICEQCGNLGKQTTGNYVRTLCDAHNTTFN